MTEEKNNYEGEVDIELAVQKELPARSRLTKPVYAQFVLPGSIILAALLISGTLLYTRIQSDKGAVQIGDSQPVKIEVGSEDHVLGSAKAKVTIVEFADFRCPFCERFYQESEKQMIKDYVDTGKARFVFKHFAFLGPQSTWASEAAECASEQGKFWEFHNWLYDNQAPESDLNYYSKTNLIKYAGSVGLDVNQFGSCLNSDKYSERVTKDANAGRQAGVSGTPTVFINGQKIVGAQPFAQFQQAIDAALK